MEEAAQGGGGFIILGSVQKVCGCGTWGIFSGEQGSAGLMVELTALRSVFL